MKSTKMKKTKDMRPDASVPVFEKFGFALGGAAANFMSTLIATFLLVYYTNVVRIDAGVVGAVLGISRVFDGLSDLAAGWLIDHTKSKYGKCRPWQLYMIIPFIICLIFMFWVPEGFSNVLKIAYIFVTYNLVNTVCLTILSVSHAALNGAMSIDQKSRGINGGLLMLLAVVMGIVMNSTTLQITSAVGGGNPYTQAGWTAMAVIYGIVFGLFTILGFLTTTERVTLAEWHKEKDVDIKEPNKRNDKKRQIKLLDDLNILIHNKYWVIFVLVMVFVTFSQTGLQTSNVYFAQYVLEDVFYYTPLANAQSIGSLVGVILALILMTKFKKRNLCLTGICLLAVGSFMPFFCENITFLIVAGALKGFGQGLAACVLPGMLQDTITYGIWKSGRDILGMGNAAYSFCSKVGGALATILLGFILSAGGFDGALQVQPDSAIAMIKVLYIWIPSIMMVAAAFAMYKYDLDNKYDQIASELKDRMGRKE